MLARIGAGGMGTVWRARDEMLHREVALKQVRLPDGIPERERRSSFQRLLREARLGARLRHPAICQVHDVLIVDDQPWIVMELLPGRSLDDLVERDGPLPPDQVAKIGVALLGALDAAHEAGVLHRDVKPANVIVDANGNPTLTDFGIAFELGQVSTTKTGYLVGSPAYVAPERVRGETAGPPSDIYSLGATLYTAVEGRPPYVRDSQLTTLAAAVTEAPDPMRLAGWIAPVLHGMLIKDPAQRWTSDRCRAALASGEAPAKATLPYPTPPRPADPPPPPPKRRKRGWIGVTVGLATAAVVLAADIGAGSYAFTWFSGLTSAYGGADDRFQVETAPVPVAGTKDVLVMGWKPGSDKPKAVVRRLTPASGKVVWTGPEIGEDDSFEQLVAAGTTGVAITKSAAFGFDLATGQRKWIQTLSNDLAGPCDSSCAVVAGRHVVALSKDGRVQAFDLASGRPAGNTTLESQPRDLWVVGDKVVVDDEVKAPYGHALKVIDPATGGTLHSAAPACQVSITDVHADADDWLFSADRKQVVALMSSGYSCAVGYSLPSLSKLFQHSYQPQDDDPIPSIWRDDDRTDIGGLQWADDKDGAGQLRTINPANGVVRTVFTAKNYRFMPRGIVAGVAIVEAAPSFDSEKPEIWAIDVATGKRLWNQSSRVKSSSDKQRVAVSAYAVVVASCLDESGTSASPCTYEGLNPRTGLSLAKTDKPEPGIIPAIDSVTSTADYVFVRAGGQLVTLDPKTGALLSASGGL